MTQYDSYTDMNAETRLGTHLVFEALSKMTCSKIADIKSRGKGYLIILRVNGVEVNFQDFIDALDRVVGEKVASRVQKLMKGELNEARMITDQFVNDCGALLEEARTNIRREVVARVKKVVPQARFEEEED